MALYIRRARRDEVRIGRGLPSGPRSDVVYGICRGLPSVQRDEVRIGRGLPSGYSNTQSSAREANALTDFTADLLPLENKIKICVIYW